VDQIFPSTATVPFPVPPEVSDRSGWALSALNLLIESSLVVSVFGSFAFGSVLFGVGWRTPGVILTTSGVIAILSLSLSRFQLIGEKQ
jgi:hypothetical protein